MPTTRTSPPAASRGSRRSKSAGTRPSRSSSRPSRSSRTATKLFVDSDNALGSPSGDVDDAFAIAALLAAKAPVAALAATFGNTTALRARANHEELAARLGWKGPILAGAAGSGDRLTEASRFLARSTSRLRVLALGPLTNIATALAEDPALATRISDLVFVGTNLTSRGRWPPYFPFDFNLTADRGASVAVLRSKIPLTLVPLDIAKTLSASWPEIAALRGDAAHALVRDARRWWVRGLVLKLAMRLPVWDLVASIYVLRPELFRVEDRAITVHDSAWVEFGRGEKRAKVVTGFDRDEVWSAFAQLLR